MLAFLLEVVGSNIDFCIHMVCKEELQRDHHQILEHLMQEIIDLGFQVHVVFRQQYHMDCNYILVLDMEQQ
jgi:hypothetical protein